MRYRILLLSSMYDGNIKTFYRKFPYVKDLAYFDHYSLLKSNSTEFCAAYSRVLQLLGHDADFISANDNFLQKKWFFENNSKKTEDLLINQVIAYQPDILWIDNLSLVDDIWIKEVKSKSPSIRLVVGYHCSPHNKNIIDTLKATDIALTCTPGMRSEFEKYGIKTFLVYHAFDNTVPELYNDNNEFDEDIVFSGSLITGPGFHNERIRFIKYLLEEGLDISLFVNLESHKRILAKNSIFYIRKILSVIGAGKIVNTFNIFEHGLLKPECYSQRLLSNAKQPVYASDMYSLFRKSKIVLNMHVGVAGQFAGNMRLFEATGCGSCLLTDNKQNISDLFEPDKEIVTYKNAEECAEKAKWLLENDEIRQQIALAGQKRTLTDHTVMKRCEQIISIFDEELSKRKK